MVPSLLLPRLGCACSGRIPALPPSPVPAQPLPHTTFSLMRLFAWHGAWSYGPRYMGAGVPLLAIGIAPVWSRAGSYLRAVLALLAVCGLGLSLMGVSTTAQPPNEFRCPALQLFWPSFSQGRFSLNQGSFLAPT